MSRACLSLLVRLSGVNGLWMTTVPSLRPPFRTAASSVYPDMKATARPYPGAMFVNGTLEQDEGANPTAALSHSYRRILGETPAIYRKNAFNDTIRFAERGHAAITFGPGEDGWPPINEYIHIGKAVAATKILALTVLDLLGVAA